MKAKDSRIPENSREFMIYMKSVQTVDNESNETELITEGYYSFGEEAIIQYDESEATGFEGSTTVVACEGNKKASICRIGSANSELVMERDKKHHCHYGTPFGDFTVGIYSHAIENNLTEDGGRLYLKYTVDINSSYISDNEIYIKIEQKLN